TVRKPCTVRARLCRPRLCHSRYLSPRQLDQPRRPPQRRRRMVLRRRGLLRSPERARHDDRRWLCDHPWSACRHRAVHVRGGSVQRSPALARRRILALQAARRQPAVLLRTPALDLRRPSDVVHDFGSVRGRAGRGTRPNRCEMIFRASESPLDRSPRRSSTTSSNEIFCTELSRPSLIRRTAISIELDERPFTLGQLVGRALGLPASALSWFCSTCHRLILLLLFRPGLGEGLARIAPRSGQDQVLLSSAGEPARKPNAP